MLKDWQKTLIHDYVVNMIVEHYYWFSDISDEQQQKDIEEHANQTVNFLEEILENENINSRF